MPKLLGQSNKPAVNTDISQVANTNYIQIVNHKQQAREGKQHTVYNLKRIGYDKSKPLKQRSD